MRMRVGAKRFSTIRGGSLLLERYIPGFPFLQLYVTDGLVHSSQGGIDLARDLIKLDWGLILHGDLLRRLHQGSRGR